MKRGKKNLKRKKTYQEMGLQGEEGADGMFQVMRHQNKAEGTQEFHKS